MRRNITFGDVLGGSRPDTHEKVLERWCYLKSEHRRKEAVRAWKGGVVSVILVGVMLIGMISLGIAAIFIQL